jgi:phage gp46-like protein
MAQLSNTNPCAPPVERCESPNYPLFTPGISTRMIPQCSVSFCDCPQVAVGRYRVTAQGALDRSHWIEGWIINQLSTRGEVSCEEHPLGKRDGGWWADSFRTPAGFRSGSKLWSLQWRHVTNDALITAKQYASEALQYLVVWGIASRLIVETSYISRNVMQLAVKVIGPGNLTGNITVQGQSMPNAGWLWQEYKP